MGSVNTGSAIYFIASAAFAAPYTCHVTTFCARFPKVSLNLAASLNVPREKVTFSSPDLGAVNFSLGDTAVLPLDACAPRRCQSCQDLPILLFLDLLFLNFIFLDLLLLLNLLFFFTFALVGLAFTGLDFYGFDFFLDLLFFFTYLTYTFAK